MDVTLLLLGLSGSGTPFQIPPFDFYLRLPLTLNRFRNRGLAFSIRCSVSLNLPDHTSRYPRPVRKCQNDLFIRSVWIYMFDPSCLHNWWGINNVLSWISFHLRWNFVGEFTRQWFQNVHNNSQTVSWVQICECMCVFVNACVCTAHAVCCISRAGDQMSHIYHVLIQREQEGKLCRECTAIFDTHTNTRLYRLRAALIHVLSETDILCRPGSLSRSVVCVCVWSTVAAVCV